MGKFSVRTGIIGYNLNKMSQEVRLAAADLGMEILGELAQKVADEANLTAPFIEHELDLGEAPLRRGPNKFGKSDSGPIKGNVFAQESQKVPFSWVVCSPAWYSHFVEFGTSMHEMPRKSKTGKKMVFPGTNQFEGSMIETAHVTHPGLTPRPPFLRPAADKAENFLREILRSRGWKTQ